MSKGSTQRPRSVADDEWASRWNNIFGKDSIDDFKLSVDANKDQQKEIPDDMARQNTDQG